MLRWSDYAGWQRINRKRSLRRVPQDWRLVWMQSGEAFLRFLSALFTFHTGTELIVAAIESGEKNIFPQCGTNINGFLSAADWAIDLEICFFSHCVISFPAPVYPGHFFCPVVGVTDIGYRKRRFLNPLRGRSPWAVFLFIRVFIRQLYRHYLRDFYGRFLLSCRKQKNHFKKC